MTKEKFKSLIESGVDVAQYILLTLFNMNIDLSDLFTNLKIRGYREALIKKGYLSVLGTIYEITEKGRLLITGEELSENTPVESEFQLFVKNLNIKIEDMISAATGKKKLRNKSGKIYNCSDKELSMRLQSFFKKFGFHDLEMIERAILKYTKAILSKEVPYALRLIFFIWKEKGKDDIESEMIQYFEEEPVEEKPKNVRTKDLF